MDERQTQLFEIIRSEIKHEDDLIGQRVSWFTAPLGEWFRGPLRETLCARLEPARVDAGALLDAGAVNRLVREHLDGRADHGRVLWALVVFEAWRDQ